MIDESRTSDKDNTEDAKVCLCRVRWKDKAAGWWRMELLDIPSQSRHTVLVDKMQ